MLSTPHNLRRMKPDDKPAKNVEVVDREKLGHGVATDKKGDELVASFLVSFYHQPLVPEIS